MSLDMNLRAPLRRGLMATILGLVCTLSLLVTMVGPANAAPPSGWKLIVDLATGRKLVIADNNQPTAARTQTSWEPNFLFIPKEGGYYEIVQGTAVWTCLDSNHAGNAYGLSCNGGDFQRWQVIDRGTRVPSFAALPVTVYEIRNKATGRCLDSNHAGEVYAIACNGGDFQLWWQRAWI